uniref:POTRA domain-containing protein n=1 Tax=Rhodymenia pseudopalmata TaxID=31502 RepID=A0A1C9C7I0_RHOPU|nr:hypothetical protein Rhodyp_054 [Rhodymenia pseudopalmata]AOM64332.1 hypothetical protein Rhodyp_054 [Rhodymenia pseudopalmata]
MQTYEQKQGKTSVISFSKIQLNNVNKRIIDKLIDKKIIFQWRKIKSITKIRKVKNILKNIQCSGYFRYIKATQFSDYNENTKSLMLALEINPVLKKINIFDHSKLQIPKYLLKKIFEQQIGLPKNYTKIQKSIKKISFWYQHQGFKYANIRLIDTQNSGDIYIIIDEGIVRKIETASTRSSFLTSHFNQNLKILIKKELSIYINNPLSTRSLDLFISRLKYLNLCHECNYVIQLRKTGIYIKIYYETLDQSRFYLYYKNQFIENYRQLIELLLYNLIQFSYGKKFFTIMKLLNFHSSIADIKEYLRIYCYLIRSRHIDNFAMNAQISNRLLRMDALIFKYYLQTSKDLKIIAIFIIHAYTKISARILFNPLTYIVKKKMHYAQITNLKLKSSVVNFLIKHSFINDIIIIQNLLIYKNRYNVTYLSIKNLNLTIDYSSCSIINNIACKLNISQKKIQNKLIYLKIATRCNLLYLIEETNIGKYFEIQSKLLAAVIKSIDAHFYKLNHLTQVITGKYIHCFYIPKVIPYIRKNLLSFSLEYNFLINQKSYICMHKEAYCDKKSLNNGLTVNLVKYSYCFLSIEYHAYQWKYLSTYLFYKFIGDYFRIINIKKGIGVQVNIPIKKLSNVKIEYMPYQEDRSRVYMFNHPKYN